MSDSMASTTMSTDKGFQSFSLLKENISKLLQKVDFFTLKRALLYQTNTPRGIQFPDDLHQSIKAAENLDALLDILIKSGYLSPVDLRLLDELVISLQIEEAQLLLKKYKDAMFPKNLHEISSDLTLYQQLYQQREHSNVYTIKVASRLQQELNEVTVGKLLYYCNCLERNIMDINNGSCVLKDLDSKCHEVHWLIPTHCKFHAYNSALRNRYKFCDIHLQYLHVEPYPPIYDPFTIQPAVLSTLLHLPRPIASTPAEAINHYYCFLADNLDHKVICQVMLKLEVINREFVYSVKMYSDYQINAFLLDQLLITDRSKIIEFCYVLQSTDYEQEIGIMLVNTMKSISTDGVDSITDRQSSFIPAISEEDDADINPIYQPKVFWAAKTVHIRFVNLVAKLKQELKGWDSQVFLEKLRVLNASVKIIGHFALLPSEYLEDLSSANTEEILDRVAFLWSWNDHSILRAVLEAYNYQKGIEMLENFESQIDATQPMELFPIPPPSMKMAPPPSSAFTVLSIRVEYDKDEPVPLQYVNDLARVMSESFWISSHALQLLAARTNCLMLCWMIPKSIVPLVSKRVKEDLDFLKKKRFLEVAIYPNTNLFSTDNSSHGLFASLSIHPQVHKQNTTLKTEVSQLKTHKEQLSSELDKLKDEYQSLSQEKSTFINESERIMCQLEGMLIDTKSSLNKLPFLTKHKGSKEKETFIPPDQDNDMVSDVTKGSSTFLNRLQSFKVEFKEMKVGIPQDVCSYDNLKPDLDVRVKELEYALDEKASELEMNLAEIKKLKLLNKSLTSKNLQLKKEHNLNECNSGMVSHSTTIDYLKQESTQSDVSSLNSPGRRLGHPWINEASVTGKAIKVRYGKVLLSGSCDSGKTSFFRLLIKFKDQYKNVGLVNDHTIIFTTKVSLKQSSFNDDVEFQILDFDSEISQLTHICKTLNNESSLPTVPSTADEATETSVRASTTSPPITGIVTDTAPNSETEQVLESAEKIWDILTFVDTGGTPEHISMLLTVNSSVMATFFVHKMEGGVKSLDNPVTLKHSGKSHPLAYSNLDFIKKLISFTNNIFLHKKPFLDEICCKEGNYISHISFIGTHLDQVSENEVDKIEEVLATAVHDSQSNNVLAKVNPKYKYLIPVDNTAGEDEIASKIRSRIYSMLQEQSIYKVPCAWLLLEVEIRKICKTEGYNFITFGEVLKLRKWESFVKNDHEDFIRDGLKFHHSFGVLLYFDEVEGMRDLIITDHKWLFNSLTNIILKCCSELTSRDECGFSRGRLHKTLLNKINLSAKFKNDAGKFNIVQSLLNLLQHLKIIAPLENSCDYFMPSLLDSCIFSETEQKILQSHGTKCIVTNDNLSLPVKPLLIQFTLVSSPDQVGCFPRGVFCCLIVQLLQNYQEKWKLQWSACEKKVFSNLVTFYANYESCGHYITLIDRLLFLEVHVTHISEYKISCGSTIYHWIADVIGKALHKVGESLDFQEFDLNYGFLCDECSKSEAHMTIFSKDPSFLLCYCNRPTKITLSHKVWIDAFTSSLNLGINQKSSLDTINGDDGESEALEYSLISTASKAAQTILTKRDDGESEAVSSLRLSAATVPTQTILDKKPEVWKLIKIVIPEVKAYWKKLGYSIKYKTSQIKAIEKDGKDVDERCIMLLENWLDTPYGCTPKTWGKLIERISDVDELYAAAERIQEKLLEGN